MAKSPFLEGVRSEIRLRGYSMRTEKTYIHWIKRFIFFHQKRHPQLMGAEEVRSFLTSLAVQGNVAINIQPTAQTKTPRSAIKLSAAFVYLELPAECRSGTYTRRTLNLRPLIRLFIRWLRAFFPTLRSTAT